jgi:hypothetical protein
MSSKEYQLEVTEVVFVNKVLQLEMQLIVKEASWQLALIRVQVMRSMQLWIGLQA